MPSFRIFAVEYLVYELLSVASESSWSNHAKVQLSIVCPIWVIVSEELISNASIENSCIRTISRNVVFPLQVTWSIHVLANLPVEEAVVNVLNTRSMGVVVITFS